MDEARPGTGQPRRRVRTRVKICGAALASLFALACGELAARVVYPTLNPRRHFRPGIYRADPKALWVHLPNYAGVCANYYEDVPVHTNSLGLRGPEPGADDARAPLRVLCLGDSNTFGLRVGDEETFPACLRRLLAAQGVRAAVWNTGHCGYDTEQERVMLERFAPRLHPQVVVLYWLQNDLLRSADLPVQVVDGYLVENRAAYERFRREVLEGSWRTASRLATLVSIKWRGWRHDRKLAHRLARDARNSTDPKAYARNFADVRALVERARALGARVVVVAHSAKRDLLNGRRNPTVARFESDVRALGVPLVSNFEVYAPHLRDGPPLYVRRDDAHPTGRGHALTAEAVLPHLLSEESGKKAAGR
ncbi:MAG: SGNH/GDSL hydrolase family protein [Planctomycetota bacterium]|nr:MAG: SGNH/GDSL hydrolase family protein [Planctomycetota bacterium]